VDVAPCAELHDAEAVSQFDLPEGGWPGMAFSTRQADRRCLESVGSAAADAPRAGAIEALYSHPTEESRRQHDRTPLCVALFPDPRRGQL